jgi:enoyl-CoA hydratase/carnithine racemase
MDEVQFQVFGHVAILTFNRPDKLNAVTPLMATLINDYARRCDDDSAVRVIILTGAGERAFCAGSDIRQLEHYPTAWSFRNRRDYCDAIRRVRKPTVAAINGFALGGGLELAMSCDIRIAAQNARFAAPEIKLGWIGGGGMSAFLSQAIGPSNAAFMLMTGDMIDADQALAWRLVTELLPRELLLDRAMEIAATIADRAPIAAECAKANLHAAHSMPIEAAIQYERDLQTVCFSTDDAREGRAAFAEKRPPLFTGR